jgi:ribosomal-protein-alanine N-acetyltransferase
MEAEMNQVKCNRCGKTLKENKGIILEDYISVCKPWGYFSRKDGKTQEFVLCETCTEHLTKEFVIPINEYDTKEMI